jgi:thiol-disulfide isomerase/thioredoxin
MRSATATVALAAWLATVGLTTPALSAEAETLLSAAVPHASTSSFGLDSQLAPDFARTDVAGHVVRLGGYRGKVVLLNFWATWCAPCLDEIPVFSRWQQKYGLGGLQVLGVSLDDDAAPVRRAVSKYHVAYPVIMSDEKLLELYGGVLGLPLSFIIDPSGRIVGRFQGKSDLTRMENQLKAMLPRPRT